MLDLGFVRGNLDLVEENLRARGADPGALLGDFRSLDKRRRDAITQAETLKARRNDLSQQVGILKKSGQDATALMDETRALKDTLDELDKTAAALDEQMRLSLARIPNLTRDEVPAGTSEKVLSRKPVSGTPYISRMRLYTAFSKSRHPSAGNVGIHSYRFSSF